MSISDYIFTNSYNDDYSYELSRSMSKYDYAKNIEKDFGVGGYRPTLARKNESIFRESEVSRHSNGFSDGEIKNRKLKSIYNYSFYGTNDIDTVVYYDLYKERPRLNIEAHGTVDYELFGDEKPRIIIGQEYLDGRQLADFAQHLRSHSDFDSIRLLTCHSAEGGDGSLISEVSAALKVPVKGYEGRVVFHGFSGIKEYAEKVGTDEAIRWRIITHSFGRGPDVNEVVKGSGLYMRPGNTMMAGLEFF